VSRSGSNHAAIEASYVAVVANASAASRRRVPGGSAPSARSSSSTASYCAGEDTAATCSKFLAAPRSSAGPPMSIISADSLPAKG